MRSTLSLFASMARNRDLRRLEVAYAGFNTTDYATWLAMLLFAYRHGGATTASIVAFVQLVPAALSAPFAAVITDRSRPVRVLVFAYFAQAASMAATAAAIVIGAPAPLAYGLAAVATTLLGLTRPAQATVTPALARTPEELTATNVASGWIENAGILASTAATGVVLAIAGPGAVFFACAAISVAAGVLVAPIDGPPAPPVPEQQPSAAVAAMAGLVAIVKQPGPRLLVALLGVEYVIWGSLNVLFVVLALKVLAVGAGWVGYLNAAFAAGGLLGSVFALALVGRRRFAPPIVVAMLLWGAAFMLIATTRTAAIAALLLVIGGGSRAVFDVAASSLLQRVSPAHMLGRVFGVLEGIETAGLAIGAIVVPLAIAIGGSDAALVGIGALLPLALALFALPLVRTDSGARVPIVEIALLRSMPMFASLPAPAIEGLAHALVPLNVEPGAVIIREGDEGDRFYAVADGTVDVTHHGHHVAKLGRPHGFGEIALLARVPRTATVTAETPVLLYALDSEPFLSAVTGHAPAAETAQGLVETRRSQLAELKAPAGDGDR